MKIVIVGGVAGGASCATRARRLGEEAEIVVFERGDHVSFANCGLPYYIGGTIQERNRLLVATAESLRRRFNLDIRTRSEVVSVDREAHEVTVQTRDGETYRESYDKLVLAPGAEPVRPPIEGVGHPRIFTLRNVRDTDRIKEVVDSGAQRALVVGAGYIGVEMAENLRDRGMDVTLIELLDQVMPIFDAEMAELIQEEMESHGVRIVLGNPVERFGGDENTVRATLADGTAVEADLGIVCVGVRPETGLAREAGIELGVSGGIKVDEFMRTTDTDVYAVGDAVQVADFVTGEPALVPLAGPANRQGRSVADHIFGRPRPYRGTQGTAVVKVFGVTAGSTGASERTLQQLDRPYEKVYVFEPNHARYYPGAALLAIKALFSPGEPGEPGAGKLLGAQVIGREGTDKRVDVLATAIRAGMTVFDLQELELAYAPPYGSAKDAVNMVGFVASNVLEGTMPIVQPETVVAGENPEAFLLDVRNAEEYEGGHIPNAYLIPLNELRERLDELPKDRPITVYCRLGVRSYFATRILLQNGFQARDLTGSWESFRRVRDARRRSSGKT